MGQVFIGRKLFDPDGNTIGTITDVIVDSSTLEPEWITVKPGAFGKERLVPAEAVTRRGEEVTIPFERDRVKQAPPAHKDHVAPSLHEREEIFAHYGITETT